MAELVQDRGLEKADAVPDTPQARPSGVPVEGEVAMGEHAKSVRRPGEGAEVRLPRLDDEVPLVRLSGRIDQPDGQAAGDPGRRGRADGVARLVPGPIRRELELAVPIARDDAHEIFAKGGPLAVRPGSRLNRSEPSRTVPLPGTWVSTDLNSLTRVVGSQRMSWTLYWSIRSTVRSSIGIRSRSRSLPLWIIRMFMAAPLPSDVLITRQPRSACPVSAQCVGALGDKSHRFALSPCVRKVRQESSSWGHCDVRSLRAHRHRSNRIRHDRGPAPIIGQVS